MAEQVEELSFLTNYGVKNRITPFFNRLPTKREVAKGAFLLGTAAGAFWCLSDDSHSGDEIIGTLGIALSLVFLGQGRSEVWDKTSPASNCPSVERDEPIYDPEQFRL